MGLNLRLLCTDGESWLNISLAFSDQQHLQIPYINTEFDRRVPLATVNNINISHNLFKQISVY